MSPTAAGCAAMPEVVPTSGTARGAFADVTETFARSVAAQGTGGAALCVVHHGEVVVDLVGGDYRSDTLQLLFSVSKALTAIAAAVASQHGVLDLDEPVAARWPELDRASTRGITPRMVLTHRSGIASLDRPLTFGEVLAGADDDAVGAQEPYWTPGSAHGYHSFTFGPLMNGTFRRALGRSVGEYLADEVVGPRGLDLWLGAPDGVLPRVSPIRYSAPAISEARRRHSEASAIPPGTGTLMGRSTDYYNDPRLHRACWPSVSAIGSARALAELFAATLRPGELLAPHTLAAMTATQSRGHDLVLGVPSHFGSGVQRPFPLFPMLGRRSFGHEGAGGSAALADDELDVAVGYTTNVYPRAMGASTGFLALLATIRHCLSDR